MRTIPILSGLAILGVVLNHSNWHILREFTAGAAGGYPYLITDQYGKFAIAAFMFIAGYFIAYATSGGKRDLPWEMVRSRLLTLLWPWLIWSAVMTVGQSFQGRPLSLAEFARNLFVQYYFVPLLIIGYLLAPFIARWARLNTKALLLGAGALHLISLALFYVRVYWPGFPTPLDPWVDLGPLLFLRFGLYFPLGMAAGMFPKAAKERLAGVKRFLPWLIVGFYILSVGESMIPYRIGGEVWPVGDDQTKLTSALLSLSIMLFFVSADKINLPLSRLLNKLGTNSYGLYLSHYVILGILAKIIRQFLPWLAAQGWLFLPVLFFATATLAVLLMDAVSRLPVRPMYRYLFG